MKSDPLSCIEISRSTLLHNLAALKKRLRPGTAVAAVVKANAYGHGQRETMRILEGKVDCFQVDDLPEARIARQETSRPILILGALSPQETEEALALGCIVSLLDAGQLPVLSQAAQRTARPARVHLAVDAYFGREGVLPDQVPAVLEAASRHPLITIEGIYAHFAAIDDPSGASRTASQEAAYREAVEAARSFLGRHVTTHISATAGSLVRTEASESLVRLGIGLYGLWPSPGLRDRFQTDGPDLRPVLRWTTRVVQVKEVPAGYPIGYGMSFTTSRPTRIALLPQGYSDGLDRGLSGCGEVLIGGRRCALLGRVAMNMCVADVSETDAATGDEAVLLGEQGNERLTAEMIANKLSTINYEVVARISPLLSRRIT